MIIVEGAGITDVGQKRKGNEDSYFIEEDLKLYVVADGMGGHQAGEVASDLVVKTMRNYMQRALRGDQDEDIPEKPDENDTLYNMDKLVEYDQSLSKQSNYLNSSIHLANRVVYQVSKSKPKLRGMGSTVSSILFTDEDTFIAGNVGDSPIYLIRDNKIELISMVHTVLAEQMRLNPGGTNKVAKEYWHMLTRGMGIDKAVEPDICELQCFKNDIIVICSDGLSDEVKPEEIQKIVEKTDPKTACHELVDLANARGGRDNITIIVIKVKSMLGQNNGFWAWLGRLFK